MQNEQNDEYDAFAWNHYLLTHHTCEDGVSEQTVHDTLVETQNNVMVRRPPESIQNM